MSAATLAASPPPPVPDPPPRQQLRVWLDLEVPAGNDVDRLLTDALWSQLTICPSDPADLTVGFEAVGYYVESYCRVCGCTETNACAGGCSWLAPDLCSACAAGDDRDVETVAVQGNLL